MFDDRVAAGRRLAQRLEHRRGEDLVVLGLPRGGVPVAAEVAAALGAPLDVIVVRKLGVPWHPELAMGAIGEGGLEVLDDQVVGRAGVTDEDVRRVVERERAELESRIAQLRAERERVGLDGRTAVIVDDGIATGATARVACRVARHLGAADVVLAVPVAPPRTLERFEEADEVVCVEAPAEFRAVGLHYRDFEPTTDEEVVALLDAAAIRPSTSPAPTAGFATDAAVEIPADGVRLPGDLRIPEQARGVVVFAHGSGSSRHSRRNRFVASVLYDAGLGTLLLDLLTPAEGEDRANVFDIGLLAERLGAAVGWIAARPEAEDLPVGLFGASTGAAAALWAATESTTDIGAVVSRGGRPDLAGERLDRVAAPTLLIVGEEDTAVLPLNEEARARLRCPNRLEIVPDAGHLFEEPGTLEAAAELARDWFLAHLVAARGTR